MQPRLDEARAKDVFFRARASEIGRLGLALLEVLAVEREQNEGLRAAHIEVMQHWTVERERAERLEREKNEMNYRSLEAQRETVKARAERDRAVEALNCEHNHDRPDEDRAADLWEYVEHEGKTWNRCRLCGLLELWEGGMFVDVAVLAEQEKPQ